MLTSNYKPDEGNRIRKKRKNPFSYSYWPAVRHLIFSCFYAIFYPVPDLNIFFYFYAFFRIYLVHHPLRQLLWVSREEHGGALDVQRLRDGFVGAEVGTVPLQLGAGLHCPRRRSPSDVVEQTRQQNLVFFNTKAGSGLRSGLGFGLAIFF